MSLGKYSDFPTWGPSELLMTLEENYLSHLVLNIHFSKSSYPKVSQIHNFDPPLVNCLFVGRNLAQKWHKRALRGMEIKSVKRGKISKEEKNQIWAGGMIWLFISDLEFFSFRIIFLKSALVFC